MLGELGIKDDPLLEVAMELEQIALTDEYFIEKKLYPNVDFYSGITLKAIGFPTTMFTVLFALARTVGWIAQWKEMIEDPRQKIGRPRQLYTGAAAARLRAGRASAADRGATGFSPPALAGRRRQDDVGGDGRSACRASSAISASSCARAAICRSRSGVSRQERLERRASRSGVSLPRRGIPGWRSSERSGSAARTTLMRFSADLNSLTERIDAVGDDHRHAGKRQFQRHRAGGGERRMRRAGRRRTSRPRPRRSAACTGQPAVPRRDLRRRSAATAGSSDVQRPVLGNDARHRLAEDVEQPLDLAVAAARQDEEVGRSPAPSGDVRRRAGRRRSSCSMQRVADIGARRAAEPPMHGRLERQEASTWSTKPRHPRRPPGRHAQTVGET